MEGMGIWIFLLLFYLLQVLTKRKQKQQRLQQSEETSPKPPAVHAPIPSREKQKPKRPVSLEDLFNPEKLRDMLSVPQPEPVERSKPEPIQKPIVTQKVKPDMRQRWEEPQQSKPSLNLKEEARETLSKVASADITDVDESATDFRAHRMSKSDITSDRFDERKTAPGQKEEKATFDFFDEQEDIRNAVILKEILDRPRAFRRQIR